MFGLPSLLADASRAEHAAEVTRSRRRIDAGIARRPEPAPSWLFGTDGAQVRADAIARLAHTTEETAA